MLVLARERHCRGAGRIRHLGDGLDLGPLRCRTLSVPESVSTGKDVRVVLELLESPEMNVSWVEVGV